MPSTSGLSIFSEVNSSLNRLFALRSSKDKQAKLEAALDTTNAVLRLFVSEKTRTAGEIVDDHVLQFPSTERQDHWFQKHPWMGDERSAFSVFEGAHVPVEAKFYWLNKRARQYISGAVHFTDNWEDREFTRNEQFRIGLDFFLTPEGESVLLVVSNKGSLRVLELSERLTHTQIDILTKWIDLSGVTSRERIHDVLWSSMKLQSVNNAFYVGIANAFTELQQHLVKSGKPNEPSKLFASRMLGRLIFVWFLRGMGLVSPRFGYFEAELDSLSYYRKRLEPLFFETLNTPISERFGSKSSLGDVDTETPYLNGGLFEPQSDDWYLDENLSLPQGFFIRLFEHFEAFNFTTDESTPEYEQIAVDPEMLGRVFESLLATQLEESGEQARKALGAFYTPREIVAFICRESLRNYASSQLEDSTARAAFDALLDTEDREWARHSSNALRDKVGRHRSQLEAVLKTIKVIDPACGSGAFPMGMLQLLVKMLWRLDPSKSDYQRKLDIIQNSIFGIDRDPMAVEIARLRAWLTLVVEDDAKTDIRPLPNLNFKFVCANSLLPIDDGGNEIAMFHDLEAEGHLAEIRRNYFTATSPDEKVRLKSDYRQTSDSLRGDFSSTRSRQLSTFDPFSYSSPAAFFDPEVMFGVSDGFHLVVGNPPYIDYRKIPADTKSITETYRIARHSKQINLYLYFFELGLKLASRGGVVAYITPQQYLSYPNTKGLRDLISENRLIRLADFARVKVFDASTYTFVTIISKEKSSGSFEYAEYSQTDDLSAPIKRLEFDNPLPEPFDVSDFSYILKKLDSQAQSTLGEISHIFCASSSTSLEVSNDDTSGPRFLEAKEIHQYHVQVGRKFVTRASYSGKSAQKQVGPRIYTSRMTNIIRAAMVDKDDTLGGKVNVVVPVDLESIHSVLALLNSKVANFWIREKFSMQHMQGGALPLNTPELRALPVPMTILNSEDIRKLVETAADSEGDALIKIQEQIDQILFEAFNLTADEVSLIKKRFEEYGVKVKKRD